MARILSIADPAARAEAVACIRRQGIVAFPTETVYGLGADARNAQAVARIFEAKKRPSFDPLIVHVADPSLIPSIAEPDPRLAALAKRFWPGPLTVVLKKRESIPDIVTAGLATVGVRVPGHALARTWLEACGCPVAAPSANPFGYVSPTTAAHVAAQLGDAVDMILDGGSCDVGLESTIVSLAEEKPTLLRPGAILREELEALIGPVEIASDRAREKPAAPGMLVKHYATRTPLILLDSAESLAAHANLKAGALLFRPRPGIKGFGAVEVLAPDGSLRSAAASLFASLRRLDVLNLETIVAEPVPEEGLGIAIMDRLRRCAAGL